MKKKKLILIVCFILMSLMLIAAAPMQEGEPVDANAFDLLAPAGEWAAKIFTVIFAVVIFLFGTIQGTQLVKITLPKIENAKWLKIRRSVIRGVSIAVAVFGVVGANLDLFGVFESMDVLFGVDPAIGQMFSGLALSLGANWMYDNHIDVG